MRRCAADVAVIGVCPHDQQDVSAGAAERGAGFVLDVNSSDDAILNAARCVLGDVAFRVAARRVVDSIKAKSGVDGALAVVDHVLGGARGC